MNGKEVGEPQIDAKELTYNSPGDSGWRPVSIELGLLKAGTYKLGLLGEAGPGATQIFFDDVVVTGTDQNNLEEIASPDGGFVVAADAASKSDEVIAIAGRFGVTASGSASYRVPLSLPVGVGNVIPQLALNYNSSGGAGHLGMGWSLSGSSVIERCAQTLQFDGTVDPVDFDDNDKFCLNGERLVAIRGDYAGNGTEYRTGFEQFSRIISYGNAGNGPAWFKVWTKAGTVLEFGNTADSRIEAVGGKSARAWAVNRMQDRAGNYATWTYFEDAVNGEYGVRRIEYTGNQTLGIAPGNSVIFDYEDEFDDEAAPTRYLSGQAYRRKKRLSTITIEVANNMLRKYRMAYESHEGTSYLQSLTQCEDQLCFKPTLFDWTQPDERGFDRIVLEHKNKLLVVASGDFNGDGLSDLYKIYADDEGRKISPLADLILLSDGKGGFDEVVAGAASSLPERHRIAYVGDFNGDGRADLLSYDDEYFEYNDDLEVNHPVIVWLSNRDGTFNGKPLETGLAYGYDLAVGGDLNRDGRSDLYFYAADEFGRSSGEGRDQVWISKGDGQFSITQLDRTQGPSGKPETGFQPIAAGHFDADGTPDVIWAETDEFGRMETADTAFLWRGNGKGGFERTSIGSALEASLGSLEKFAVIATGDANGDGLTDLAVASVEEDGRTNHDRRSSDRRRYGFFILHSKGDGEFHVDNRTNEMPADARVLGAGDFNGDNRFDMILASTAEARYTYDGRGATVLWGRPGENKALQEAGRTSVEAMRHLLDDFVVATGDFNGDGRSDLYAVKPSQGGRSLQSRTAEMMLSLAPGPRQLTRVENGIGLATTISYRNLTDSAVYEKGSGTAYPARDVVSTRHVVAEVSADNGIGGTNRQSYRYEGLRHEVTTGSLGFAAITVTDHRSGIVSRAQYSQDHAAGKQGLLIASRTLAPDGSTALVETSNEWTVRDLPTSDGTLRRFRYRQSSQTTKRDPDGSHRSTVGVETTFNEFGSATRIVETTTGDGNTYINVTDNRYDADDPAEWLIGRVTSSTLTQSAPGAPDVLRQVAFTYHATTGMLTSETAEPNDALSYTRSYDRNGFGLVTSVRESWGSGDTDGMNADHRISTVSYDETGRFKLSEVNPLGHKQSYTYDIKRGFLLTTTGPNGLTTRYDYDDAGRLEKETRADGSKTTIVRLECKVEFFNQPCPDNTRAVTIVQTDGAPKSIVYRDILGRTIQTVTTSLDGRGSRVDTAYNELGRVISVSNPYFHGDPVHVTRYEHDPLGRVIAVSNPDGSSRSTHYSGRIVRRFNELGQAQTATLDARGLQTGVTDALGSVTTYAYDAASRPVSVINAAGNVTTMAYDVHGNKVAMNDPDMGNWSYRHNALGLAIEQTDARGQVTQMTYDLLGRMLSRTDDATGTTPQTATWVYDQAANGIGKLAGSSNKGYEAVPAYDGFGRASQLVETIDGETYSFTTTYDAFSRLETLTYPSGLAVKQVYNASGHLSQVQDVGSGAAFWQARQMDAFGNVTQFQLGNGATSWRSHDAETGRLVAINSNRGRTIVQDLAYAFDDLGNLTQRSDRRQGYTENSVYDSLNRIIQVKTATGVEVADTAFYKPSSMWAGTETSISVAYDALGNITAKTDVGNYTYGATATDCAARTGAVIADRPHAVSSLSGVRNVAFCYDANGNMLSGLDPDGVDQQISWTPFNKPDRIVKGSNTVEFVYGPERNRIKRIDRSATATTTTHYAGGKLFEAVESAGHWQQKHYIGNFAVVTKAVTTGRSETHYLLHDHLGSVDTVMDASGEVVERMSFDAWGKRRQVNWVPHTDPVGHMPLVTPRGYTGHEQLDPVGLVHMNGRVYDPQIARFFSADPFVKNPFNGQNLNRYAYVLNNPLSYTDPSGFYPTGEGEPGYQDWADSYGYSPDNDYSNGSGGNQGGSGGNRGGNDDHSSSGKDTGSNTSSFSPPNKGRTGLEGSPEAQPSVRPGAQAPATSTGLEGSPEAQPSMQPGAQAPATGPYGGNGMQGSPEVAANKDYQGNVVEYRGSPQFEAVDAPAPVVGSQGADQLGENKGLWGRLNDWYVEHWKPHKVKGVVVGKVEWWNAEDGFGHHWIEVQGRGYGWWPEYPGADRKDWMNRHRRGFLDEDDEYAQYDNKNAKMFDVYVFGAKEVRRQTPELIVDTIREVAEGYRNYGIGCDCRTLVSDVALELGWELRGKR